jgi:hypothetical protein
MFDWPARMKTLTGPLVGAGMKTLTGPLVGWHAVTVITQTIAANIARTARFRFHFFSTLIIVSFPEHSLRILPRLLLRHAPESSFKKVL